MNKPLLTLFLSFALLAPTLLLSPTVSAGSFDAFEYRNVGPARGGRVTAVAGTQQEPGTFYLGASGGGVWKSADYGTSWENVSDGFFATPSIGDIAVSQSDANLIYVGTGSDGLRSNVIAGKGMYRSVDAGRSWKLIGLEGVGQIGAVEIDPGDNNTVWVAAIGKAFNASAERGVYKTEDGGQSWSLVLHISDTVGVSDIELLPANPQVAFAAAWRAERKPWTIISGGEQSEGGLYKTSDGGKNWRRIEKGLPGGLIGKIDLAISPADSSIVYALVEAPGDEGGLYRSVDQGESFVQVSSKKGLRTRPFYYGNVDVDPTNPEVVYVMATDYFRSEDGGESWEELHPPHGDNHDMWINPANPQLFIQGNDGGANVTHNGGRTWSTQFNQPTTEVYQVEVDDQYPYWLYAGQQDNYSTIAVPSRAPYGVQHRAAWLLETGGCETGPAVPKPGNHNIVYANCKGRFGVFDKRTGTERSYYVGAANMYGQNPADLRYRFQRVSPVHVSPHDPGVVYHASQFVHRTRDEGKIWETISPDLTAFEADKQVISGSPITRDITGEEFYSTIYSLRESPVQPGVIWVGANDGPVHVSRDNGESWDEVTPSGLPAGGRVDSVEPSPHDPAVAYIAVLRYQLGDEKPYIYRTDNYGKRWTLLSNGRNGIPADYPVRVVREDPVKPGLLFAGTEYGIYVSIDNGRNWESFQQNLPVTPVTDLRIHRDDLVVSTMGRGFWVLDKINAMREESTPGALAETRLFPPASTVRYRYNPRYREGEVVPDYPEPVVLIDYALAQTSDEPILLEILNASGGLIAAYRSAVDAEGEEDSPVVVDDMALNEVRFLEAHRLDSSAGVHRFNWDMRHRGAWDADEDDRFRDGPLAAPGQYRVKLTVAGESQEQPLTLIADPRVLNAGVTEADIAAQVALQLKIEELLGSARRLAGRLEQERDALLDAGEEGVDTAAEDRSRLPALEEILAALNTAKGTYREPQLIAQISYLRSMLRGADQVPGRDAYERYAVLEAQFTSLRERAPTN